MQVRHVFFSGVVGSKQNLEVASAFTLWVTVSCLVASKRTNMVLPASSISDRYLTRCSHEKKKKPLLECMQCSHLLPLAAHLISQTPEIIGRCGMECFHFLLSVFFLVEGCRKKWLSRNLGVKSLLCHPLVKLGFFFCIFIRFFLSFLTRTGMSFIYRSNSRQLHLAQKGRSLWAVPSRSPLSYAQLHHALCDCHVRH